MCKPNNEVPCDICKAKGLTTPPAAVFDGATKMGMWAFMCAPCHYRVGVAGADMTTKLKGATR